MSFQDNVSLKHTNFEVVLVKDNEYYSNTRESFNYLNFDIFYSLCLDPFSDISL